MKINKYIKFNQKNINTYMFTIDAETFINYTMVDYFIDGKEENNGYQRPLSESHYKNIAKYLANDKQSMLPTAIIAAIGYNDIKAEEELEINDRIRIVDGQHRREALVFLKKSNEEIYNKRIKKMEFPVLLMEIDKEDLNKFIVEVQTFVNINKKGRKVSTDLALSLEESIISKLLENVGVTDRSKAITLIAGEIVNKFNRDDKTCWYEKIKTGDKNDTGRPISKNAFYNSIEPIIDNYIETNYQLKSYNKELIGNVSENIYIVLKKAWSTVSNKWPECFYWDEMEKVAEYDKDYSVQKGIGVYPIHGIISELNLEKNKESLIEFENIINKSSVESEDWMKGGIFSGFNSASGFKKIKDALKSEKEYEKLKQ